MCIADELFYHTKMYHKALKKICEPLERFFGITNVAFHLVKNNGLINIHTHPKWMEYCMEHEYFRDDPHITCNDIKNGFTICKDLPSAKYKEHLFKDGLDFDLFHGINYLTKTSYGYYGLCFSTNSANLLMQNKILNHQDCIFIFKKYLMKELNPIFKKLIYQTIDIKLLTNK